MTEDAAKPWNSNIARADVLVRAGAGGVLEEDRVIGPSGDLVIGMTR